LLVPSLVAAAPSPVSVVFVDAALPRPGQSWLSDAPPAMVAHLRGLARDGQLPPWPDWWGDRRPRLIDDLATEARLYGACRPTPWAYLEETTPNHREWLRVPKGYLQLSDVYSAEADEAEAVGWPSVRLSPHHLAMVTDPELVASAMIRLAGG
jgi:hypothetical protein